MKTFPIMALFLSLFFAQDLSAQISGQVVDLYLNRYNSATTGAKLPVEDGEILGTMHFRGWTPGDEYQSSTAIRTYVTGTPTPGYLPGRLAFYTGGSDLFNHERMTILENGNIGIGLANPQELLDINGNTIVRGQRIFLGLASPFADGGEAFTHTDTDGFTGLPGDVLAINHNGDFEGGVYVGCPGLRVCGTLETECFKTTKNLIAEQGNVVAFGGASPAVDCDTPGEGDFIAYGNNGDFIAKHGNFIAEAGDLQALSGNVLADQNITSQNGNITALSGEISADQNITSQNGHLLAPNGNLVAQNVTASTGDVEASQNVKALLGNVSADFGDVTAGQNVIAAFDVKAGVNVQAVNDVTAGVNVQAFNDVRASVDVEAGNDVIAAADVEAGNDLFATDNLRVGVNSASMPSGYRAAIAGKLICEEVRVSLQADWPDYVFEEDYQLPSTTEWEAFIKANKHLPGVPSASEVADQGIALGEMQAILLQKIEELTLIVIEQQKQIELLRNRGIEESKN